MNSPEPKADMKKKVTGRSLRELVLFSMLGTLMFSAQVAMEAIPNVHLSGMFTLLFTRVFRKKALIPIYIYVCLVGIRWGFSFSWIPYLYLWLILWGIGMLIPKNTPSRLAAVFYPAIGVLFGLSFGTLYAPSQALLFGYDFKTTLAWIAAGFPWDVVHAVGNLVACTLILPLSRLLERLLKRSGM